MIYFIFLMLVIPITVFLFISKNKENKKKDFVAGLVHDLKSPNIAQIRAIDLLLKNCFGFLTSEQKEIITQIQNSCKYMNGLIFTILDTYLYENGEKKLVFENTNINELINEIINEISYLGDEKEQKIIISSKTESQFLYIDKLQIKRVLENLIANAITYGEKCSDIHINIKENVYHLTFDIENKARYYTKKEINEMFKKYKTTNEKYIKTSSGLGLYLSKEIIRKHGGKIYAKSNRNGICTFGFTIPKIRNTEKPKEPEKTYLNKL